MRALTRTDLADTVGIWDLRREQSEHTAAEPTPHQTGTAGAGLPQAIDGDLDGGG
jgi:hypothetical protein